MAGALLPRRSLAAPRTTLVAVGSLQGGARPAAAAAQEPSPPPALDWSVVVGSAAASFEAYSDPAVMGLSERHNNNTSVYYTDR